MIDSSKLAMKSCYSFDVVHIPIDFAPWKELKLLLDACYPEPPCDVFTNLVAHVSSSHELWIALHREKVIGMVMLCRHSKGGHVENLAVLPSARNNGVARALVSTLLDDTTKTGQKLISLTTRIPDFFEQLGFRICGTLYDRSSAMILLYPHRGSELIS